MIGASVVSLGVILATFMAGLCLGSLLLWRIVSPARNPLLVFAWLEIGIAACGLTLLYLIPSLATWYAGATGSDGGGMPARVAVATLCMLPPTILMGATLPAIARQFELTPRGLSRVGLLYAANVMGAVAGALLAGYYLLRIFDVTVATYVAIALNLIVAAVSVSLAVTIRRATSTDRPMQRQPAGLTLEAGSWPVYAAIAASGLTALAAQVIWTRNLALLLGGTVYTFSLILAVFLLGIGLGSAVGSALLRRVAPAAMFAACQLLLCAAIYWAASAIADSLPYWPLDVTITTRPAVALQIDLLRVAWSVLPAALLWGASFPLAVAAAATPGQPDPGRLLGGIYAANTLGAVVGAGTASFFLVAWLGSQLAQQVLIGMAAASGLLVLWFASGGQPRGTRTAWRTFATVAAVLMLALGAQTPALPGELIAFGRFLPARASEAQILYQAEGVASSVAVSRDQNGRLTYHTAGKAQASTYPQDMRLQRMLGHLATLVPEKVESALVIGLGAGVTAGAVSIDPQVRRVVVAELEPLSAHVASTYFAAHNHSVLDNPALALHFDDGRHFLATTRKRFDVIVSDPLDPWVKGAAALYTREFWELVRSRLNPGGVVTVFLQLYENTEDGVRSEVATFLDVFRSGAVFANTVQGAGYDAVLLGRAGDLPIDVDLVQARLTSPDYAQVAQSLADVGIRSGLELLATYAGSREDLAGWLEGASINRDRNLRLQYLAGAGLNLYRADQIYTTMVQHAGALPPDLFTARTASLDALQRAILSQRHSPR